MDSAGRKIYEGQFRDNIPVDTFRYYYPDGKIKTISVFAEKGHKVKSESFYKNGKSMAKGIYRDEKRDSTWRFFMEYDGSLASEETYTKGVKNGAERIWFPGGTVVSESITWKDNIRDGPWQTWYSDGRIKMKGAYRNGEKSGPFVFYYDDDNKVMMTGEYLEGHMHGTWLYYSDKGEVVRTEKYDKGILLDRTPKE